MKPIRVSPYKYKLGHCDYCGSKTRWPNELEVMCDNCAKADEEGRLLTYLKEIHDRSK